MLTARVEALLNRQAAASPRAGSLIAALAGRRLDITVRHTPWRWSLASDGTALKLTRSPHDLLPAPDATIDGTPLSLAALAGPAPEAVIRRGDIVIDGDPQIAQRFRDLGALLHPDLEEELSRLVGDVSAHQLGLAARAAMGWLRAGVRTAGHNVAEYLAHERRDLVPPAESAGFLREVDQLREDTDRLAARVEALVARHAAR
jgi:ubiquinone biosynthesis accessory factor UbiJ